MLKTTIAGSLPKPAWLADTKKLQSIADASAASAKKYGVEGTPSFVLNGKLLEHVHDWAGLQKAMK